jgi:hypothetical protein
MSGTSATVDHLLARLQASELHTKPYPHWLLRDVLPPEVAEAIQSLPIPPARVGDTRGKRETHNATRVFFAGDNLRRHAACREVAEALQDEAVTKALEKTCWINLKGSFPRVEYCQDTEGFWLEPHTDIREKLFTMLVYLVSGPGAETWGTDIYDGEMNLAGTAPCGFNAGLIFIPGPNTWHGFRKRPVDGVRRLIIVNYVRSGWRAQDQLVDPERPVA